MRQIKSKVSLLTAGLVLGVGIGLGFPYVESSRSPMVLDEPQSSLPRLKKSYERLFAAEEVVEANIAPAPTVATDYDLDALCRDTCSGAGFHVCAVSRPERCPLKRRGISSELDNWGA